MEVGSEPGPPRGVSVLFKVCVMRMLSDLSIASSFGCVSAMIVPSEMMLSA